MIDPFTLEPMLENQGRIVYDVSLNLFFPLSILKLVSNPLTTGYRIHIALFMLHTDSPVCSVVE